MVGGGGDRRRTHLQSRELEEHAVERGDPMLRPTADELRSQRRAKLSRHRGQRRAFRRAHRGVRREATTHDKERYNSSLAARTLGRVCFGREKLWKRIR